MLEELRQKPLATRKLYAFWSAAGITGVIAGVWVLAVVVRWDGFAGPSLRDSAQAAGAFSQFFSRTKEELLNKKDEKNGGEWTMSSPATSTDPRPKTTVASSSVKGTAPSIMIATSSPRQVQVGTSTPR